MVWLVGGTPSLPLVGRTRNINPLYTLGLINMHAISGVYYYKFSISHYFTQKGLSRVTAGGVEF